MNHFKTALTLKSSLLQVPAELGHTVGSNREQPAPQNPKLILT